LTHLYIDQVPGVFNVKVTPEYNGCIGMPAYVTVTVDSPKAIKVDTVLCSPLRTVHFGDVSLGDDTHMWVFGDGATSTLKNLVHTYPLPIIYTGYLATYNIKSGCRDTTGLYFDFTRPKTIINYRPKVCDFIPDTLSTVTLGSTKPYYLFADADLSARSHFGLSVPPDGVQDTFYNSGTHHLMLYIKYADNCLDTMYFSVNSGKPVVDFNATPTTGCAPLSVNFTDASVDSPGFTPTKYAWTFGDGGTALVTSKVVPHTFTTGGTFSTKLVVTDNYGCVDSNTLNLVTVWKPKADFYTLDQTPCVGDNIQFVNKSIDGVTYSWSFGDGGTSTVTSPWHTYTANGNYTVSLTATDVHGCTDVATFVNYIATSQPSVSFYMLDSFSICPPLMTNFHNTSTGAIYYAWDLGDGNYSSAVNPSDIYTAIGYYTVTLTGTDAQGCMATAIGHASIYGYLGGFSYTPLTGCSPLAVHFKALISNVPNIIWDFSDGSTSKAAFTDTADHVYTLPGSYVPKLILSDNSGCQNSSIGVDTIKVDQVTPGYTSMPHPVCVKSTVAFNDTSTSFFSTITSWAWTMPDGSVNTTAATTWYYDTPGTYPMTFVVTDGWGCTGTLKEDIIVHPLPDVDAGKDTVICLSDKATLRATGAETYSWTADATLSCVNCNPAQANPVVATTYTVTGTDKYGCMNIDTVKVSIITKTVSHATGDAEVCRGVVVSLLDSGGTSYVWTPAIGLNNPNIANPLATPSSTQRYTVIAYLGSCIPDTEVVWVTVHQLPTVNAGEDQRLLEGSIAQLDATGTLIEKFSWVHDETLTCDSCLSTTATMSLTTTYTINVASDFGCKASDTVTIHIYCDNSQLFLPNTFTPNGDGQNDLFYPRGIGVSIVKSFRIYNRWGQLLFERSNIKLNDVSNAWDGSYGGVAPRPDVYVYVLDALCATGEPLNIKGDVTIIR
ncbi:MAG: hypothetical protein JWQ38_1552, partial [Flavipsychrobacter sp.]|nr:hypothetical protein [Flavipsychrobacter sp.]